MRWLKEKLKRAVVIYDLKGWRGVTRAIIGKMLRTKHRSFYLPTTRIAGYPKGRERRILYIDYFSHHNSNLYWLKAFRKFGWTEAFDIIRENRGLLEERIMKFKPHHIHLGGSVKTNMVPPELLSDVKSKLGCTISAFYGDRIYSPYHSELAKVVDYIYISNKSHIKTNEEKGLRNFKYMPCPTDPDVFKYHKSPKVYDVVFVGNNNQASRLPLLKKLAGLFNLKVFGCGWEETGLNFGNPVYGKEFSKICGKAKINIGILDTQWTHLETYFSNRLINTLATGSFYIQRYTQGLEKVFANRRHLVWYTNDNELIELIKYYLVNEKEREEIAAEGQRQVCQNYTYEKSVKRIIEETEQKGRLKLHLGCGSVHLDGYINIDKYNPRADRVMDVCELDYPDNSVDEIFTSHMVEHLAYSEFVKALREWKRVLKQSGTLIIRCPNAERHLKEWLSGDYKKRWDERNEGVNVILGFQDRGPGYPNRNIFTVKRLRDLVGQAGFKILECHTHLTRDRSISDGDLLLWATKGQWSDLDEDWRENLTNKKKRKGRFSVEWYNNHPITREFLNSDIWRGKVIELGCGIGTRAFLAAQRNNEVKITGVDASQYAIKHALSNFRLPNLSFLRADLLRLSFKDRTFDNAYMLAVIEHIADTNALLGEIKRVLKPKGKLFLSVTEKNYHGDPGHVHIYGKHGLRKALKKSEILNMYVKEHIIFCTVEFS